MKLFKKSKKINNKGLSLVELVCAVAIFGVATTAIGSVMVVSAQNYSRGTYELDVQQEAQTTTNLIGDLLFDANGASFDDTVANPVLVINQVGINYKIVYDKTNRILKYEEYVNGASDPAATGILAENVDAFTVPGLDKDGNNFKSDKNVEINLTIEKSGREYNAVCATTARNGAAESVGVAETAYISIASPITLEPGQTYSLPFEVAGSLMNKSVSVSASSGITVTQVGNNMQITVATNATGSIPFTVSTIEPKKDTNGNPIIGTSLATADVDVQVRRVNSITSPMDADNDGEADGNALVAGTDYKAGAEYRIDFAYVGEYLNKDFGKAYDMDYINPRQLTIDYQITQNGTVLDKNEYITGVQIDGLDNPYIRFKLNKDMPNGSEITITATAKHPNGTNKTNNPYVSTPVVDVIKIKYVKTLWGKCDFLRGSDGVFIIDSTMLKDIEDELKEKFAEHNDNSTGGTKDPQNSKRYFMTVYEVKADGSMAVVPELKRISLGTSENMKVDSVHSNMLDPKKKYVYQMELMYYTDTSRTTPLWENSPYFSEYYPLDSVSVVYTPQQTPGVANGSAKDKGFKIPVDNQTHKFNMEILGVNATRYGGQIIQFTAEKWMGDTIGWVEATDDIKQQSHQPTDQNSGKIIFEIKMDKTGIYRLKANLNQFGYKYYNGTDVVTYKENGEVKHSGVSYELTDSGYFYIDAY